MHNKFNKSEKLKSLNAFKALFSKGESTKQFPVRMVFIPWITDSTNKTQVGFSVSKRNFKNAVDRNRIKRQLRECYRLNKNEVLTNLQHTYAVLFIYIHHQSKPYDVLNEAMKTCMSKLVEFDQNIIKEEENR